MAKMTPQEFDLKATQIGEHWEARRKEIVEPQTWGEAATAAVADMWQSDEMSKLYVDSEWTENEIGARLLRRQARDLERKGDE